MNGFAERLALLDVIDRQAQRAFDHADGGGADDQPLLRQILHELVEALAFLGAEQAFGGKLHVLEEQFGGIGPIEAKLLELAAAAKAWRIAGLDHHQRGRPWSPRWDRSWRPR